MKKLDEIKNKFKATEVYFYPWVGDFYFSKENSRKLILGESHYSDKNTQELTYNCIYEVQSDKWRNAFFTKVKNICSPFDVKMKHSDFWNNVSFYNFVQKIVGTSPRVRPTEDMWNNSRTAFIEVCNILEPYIVIILGSELRKRMIALNLISIDELPYTSHGKIYYTGTIQTSVTSKKIPCICLTHPSAPRHFGNTLGWKNVLNDYFNLLNNGNPKMIPIRKQS